jgi:hypothetical protein
LASGSTVVDKVCVAHREGAGLTTERPSWPFGPDWQDFLAVQAFIWAMVSSGMPFGDTVQALVLEQPPKLSASICATMAVTRW